MIEQLWNLEVEYLDNYNKKEWGELQYKHYGDSGFDLRAAIDKPIVICPKEIDDSTGYGSKGRKLITTGIKLNIPLNAEIQIRPRSGMSFERNITVLNTPGTVDSGYKDEIQVILINLGTANFVITPGMRIAQAVLCPIYKANFVTVEKINTDNNRGGGFGHTGNN